MVTPRRRGAARTASRVLLVGQGAPGGIGRVEQLVAEAAMADTGAFADETLAIWRHKHPGYLADDTALERIPTVSTPAGASGRDFVVALSKAIRHFKPTHVMYFHVNLSPLALALRPIGHPRSYSVWTYGIDVWEQRSFAIRAALKRADRVMTISHFTGDATVDKQGVDRNKVSIVPLSLPASAFEAVGNKPTAGTVVPGRILSVSRLEKTEGGKNLDVLVRAMKPIRENHPEAHLVIVGDGDAKAELEQLARDVGLADAVSFPGRLSDADLETAYREADLFALPSEKEGFGLVFIEAMLRDTPVVGLAAGGAVDVIRDGSDGRVINTLAELPAAVSDLLSDREALESIRRTTRARVEEAFSPDRFRRDLVELFTPGVSPTPTQKDA